MATQDIEAVGDSKSVHAKGDVDKAATEVMEGVMVTLTNEEVSPPWYSQVTAPANVLCAE
jgi:hypothetical protein